MSETRGKTVTLKADAPPTIPSPQNSRDPDWTEELAHLQSDGFWGRDLGFQDLERARGES